MAQIHLPREFFTKERNTGYSNWKRAFWRELVSNALDANATEFHARLDAFGWLHIEDNGDGMSREVCEEIYLSIGRSTKSAGEGSVGGFGRARILTCFSMTSYVIHGDGYRVEGSGAEYEIFEAEPRESGLALSIMPDATNDWEGTLSQVLAQCALEGFLVTFNGKVVPTTPLIPHNGEYLALAANPDSLGGQSLGKAGFVPRALLDGQGLSSGQVYFRVNGMAMFEHYSNIKNAALIVEINPAIARDVLTANRDGLKQEGWGPVRAVIADVENEGANAVKRVHREEVFCGDLAKIKLMNPTVPPSDELDLEDRNGKTSPYAPTADGMTPYKSGLEFSSDGYFNGPMLFTVTSDNPDHLAIANSWRPGFQTPAMKRFFLAWTEACEIGLETFARVYPNQNYQWLPGLVFRSGVEAEAKCFNHYRGKIYALSINPLAPTPGLFPGEAGYNPFAFAWNLNKPIIRQRLLAVALHEIAHVKEMSHDSDYANVLTELMCEVNLARFLRASKEW